MEKPQHLQGTEDQYDSRSKRQIRSTHNDKNMRDLINQRKEFEFYSKGNGTPLSDFKYRNDLMYGFKQSL